MAELHAQVTAVVNHTSLVHLVTKLEAELVDQPSCTCFQTPLAVGVSPQHLSLRSLYETALQVSSLVGVIQSLNWWSQKTLECWLESSNDNKVTVQSRIIVKLDWLLE